ncbi:CPBP family intramembrane glutamic endopeptidase [Flavilitoribacter nigricans]|uniref:CAAX prenyl protease 2/Lysostaphin resistance protein A-like domain-containing protein n=1 Tax=Flavilitoribacter nigricans (strain ATCC 23147 / DSM 23189 / NBRC 102662 / NCIMB 1420 / SS-2) TaxID=1122177 RepID=A0A2D0NFE6_FLAN2|nr:type II CAAX endopeptidase family protein [Flavilitoribacter nigricans]PHN07222.1 hypothetical protein CRP01_08350 [Flavilitoribacter nigricans DSM 23189 = NBRC 102662]
MKLFPFLEPDPGDDNGLTNSLLLKAIFLLISVILCSLIGTLIIQLISHFKGWELATVLRELNPESSLEKRNYIRLSHLISQAFTFAIPSLLVAWFFYRRQMWRYLRLAPPPAIGLVFYGMLIILVSFPLSQFTYWLNQQIPLPGWMSNMEDQANETIQALLTMETPGVFLFNLIVIALLPSIGEELLFRGLLQQQLEKRYGRAHLAVWIAALIFSAFHMQFAGFLPRMLLGALLGYLLVWTRSLWVPIAGHFVFNGSQILGQYLLGEELIAPDPEQGLSPNWIATLVSAVLLAGLIYGIRNYPNAPEDGGKE